MLQQSGLLTAAMMPVIHRFVVKSSFYLSFKFVKLNMNTRAVSACQDAFIQWPRVCLI